MDAPFILLGPLLSPSGMDAADWLPDGALVVDEAGRIVHVGHAASIATTMSPYPVIRTNDLILPGFIDTHVHAPQLDCRGRHGADLLQWLDSYIYPAEQRFSDEILAADVSRRFFASLVSAGTTTALVFATSHEHATHIAFAEAEKCGMRIIMGSMLMDRNAPAELCVDRCSAEAAMGRLIERWHLATPLLRFAVSPRFAPACTLEMLRMAADTARRHDLHIQTHCNEALSEISLMQQLFPHSGSYTQLYHSAGLLGTKTILGHNIHTDQAQLRLLTESGAAVAHCPDSNLFLGSGRFPLDEHLQAGLRIGLGSDVGAGTTVHMLSIMRSMAHAQGKSLHPLLPLYCATLGGATALGLEHETGSLTAGKSADIIIMHIDNLLCHGSGDVGVVDVASALVYTTPEERVRRVWVAGKELTIR
jgi:guanine deaminase